VPVVEFETDDPSMRAGGGTELVGTHENRPPGVSPADDELGWRMSVGELAALVEGPLRASGNGGATGGGNAGRKRGGRRRRGPDG
jgi:hypothetical protein